MFLIRGSYFTYVQWRCLIQVGFIFEIKILGITMSAFIYYDEFISSLSTVFGSPWGECTRVLAPFSFLKREKSGCRAICHSRVCCTVCQPDQNYMQTSSTGYFQKLMYLSLLQVSLSFHTLCICRVSIRQVTLTVTCPMEW